MDWIFIRVSDNAKIGCQSGTKREALYEAKKLEKEINEKVIIEKFKNNY